MNTKEDSPLLEATNIRKSFGLVQAIKGVGLTLRHREVLGLLGNKGAGKSTLIKILVGLYRPDEGKILFEGRETKFSSTYEARAAGIEPAYQELALVGHMSVWRNFFLGKELGNKIGFIEVLNKKEMRTICKTALEQIGIHIENIDDRVSVLSAGEKQSIAISRAIHFGAKLLLLDEPTANLSLRESEKVLQLVRQAKERGLSVIFVAHNVYHVYPVSDRFVILDRGIEIGQYDKKEVTPERITNMIARGRRSVISSPSVTGSNAFQQLRLQR